MGLLCVAAKFPDVRYFLGLVSISSSIPPFYKSLMVHFLEKSTGYQGPAVALPDMPFQPEFLRVDPDQLIGHLCGDPSQIDHLDQLVGALSDGRYRMPVLVRKYFSLGARLLCFNVDPLFGYCLDGLILLRLQDLPSNSVRSFTRDLPEDLQAAIQAHLAR